MQSGQPRFELAVAMFPVLTTALPGLAVEGVPHNTSSSTQIKNIAHDDAGGRPDEAFHRFADSLRGVCSMIPALAQVTTGIVAGTVTDQTGAVVPDAPVTITNTATGATRTMNTNSSGGYRFEALPQGTYQVRCKSS